MSVQDFIKKLKEQDDAETIYSKVPDYPTKLIPPEKAHTTAEIPSCTRIIPPDTPTKIKFKFNVGSSNQTKEVEVKSTLQQVPKKETRVERRPEKPTPKKNLTDEEIAYDLFRQTGTNKEKWQIWYDYYVKAKSSRKQNSVVEQMKRGRFAITTDNQVLILPDYDLRKKSVNDILADKWLHN